MTWDEERTSKLIIQAGKDANLSAIQIVALKPLMGELALLLAEVRSEAIGWTWTTARQQYDQGRDPRRQEMPQLLERALADLNPERDK